MATVIASHPVPLLGKLESGCAFESYSLSDLISDIKQHLGSSSGISSSDVDEGYLKELLHKYQSNCDDWLPYFYNDKSKAYTRNAIENINQKANIVSFFFNRSSDIS
jgi:cysteine dioxygenase